MSNSHLPPVLSEHVFHVHSSVLIDAPREKVWDILMDFSSYEKWHCYIFLSITLICPCRRHMTVTDRKAVPLEDQTIAEGKSIQVVANMEPSLSEPSYANRGNAFVVVSHFEPENYRVAWKSDMYPSFLLATERWQILTVDEVTGKTKYENFEVFDGILAYFVKFFVGAKLAKGFVAAGESLKAHAEEMK
ncbi:hypothetical protein CPB84DRAFT_1708650 [Gymnopilus junonius]|uniref:Coenzyme Q-binding protein COQ10 START domain-containing protein n=1 Tax=Gymnopilus junonius TaxID=109634 RepID=A0A9P5TNI7_GYMJU|nr:hypothetical protein CPB84DRAFT_1708650 [Gymnopilus junonius]